MACVSPMVVRALRCSPFHAGDGGHTLRADHGVAGIGRALGPAVVTLAFLLRRELRAGEAALYVVAQVAGCAAGAVLAHALFELPLLQIASTMREGPWLLSEGAATFALVACILFVLRSKPEAVAAAVALTIAAGYWWTSSTSFANPAITIARALSDTFAGIRPLDAPGFVLAQGVGALAATLAYRWLFPAPARAAQLASTVAATRSVSKSGG
ncbi:MAG: hypothetical protein R3C16_06500 [Hyphomonadaceae bacterium]